MDELIYNQKAIPRDQWRYGFRSSAATGCGWIAIYNALLLMGYRVEIPRLIRMLERQLPLLQGNTGTALWSPGLCFRRWGFPVTVSFRPGDYDAIAASSDAAILFYYWHRKARLGAHFVALHHTGQGFIGYNTYADSKGPDRYGNSLSRFLHQRGYFGSMLVGIKDRQKNPLP